MIKNFYIIAWLVYMTSFVTSIVTGTLDGLGMMAYGLIGLALIYALALWAVLFNPDVPHRQ